MHLLRSTAIGTEIIDTIDHHIHGIVSDILIDADRGKVAALLIRCFDTPDHYALQTQDIESWGNRIHIRDAEVLGEIADFVRLKSLLEDPRAFIGQAIRTKSGQKLGRCIDVQFRSDTFDLEWIFPVKFFFMRGLALPVTEILEVTPDAIIVKDQKPKTEVAPEEVELEEPKIEVPAPATAGLRQGFPLRPPGYEGQVDRQAGRVIRRYNRPR